MIGLIRPRQSNGRSTTAVQMACLMTVPFLALTACGEASSPEGGAKSRLSGRSLNGLEMPGGAYRIYRCDAMLTSPLNESLRRMVGEEPLPITLLRAETDGDGTLWWAMGHLDKTVHRTVDPPFPASAESEGSHTILNWKIHSAQVVAKLEWRSPAQDRAGVKFDVTDPSGSSSRGIYPYQMRGECIEKPDDWLASPRGGNPRS